MNLQIDHVTVCGSDLERIRREFALIGLETEYGGAHANGLTHMALVGFDDGSYLELIAPLNAKDERALSRASGMMSGWLPLMLADAGPGAWAIRTNQIDNAVETLRQRGVTVRGPEPGGRFKPDGIQLKWKTAFIGPEPAGSLLPFMIEDDSDRALRIQPSEAARNSGFKGIWAVILAVRDLTTTVSLFQSAFAWCPPQIRNDPFLQAETAYFPETSVILSSSTHSNSIVRTRLDLFGEGPLGFLFSGSRRNRHGSSESDWLGHRVRWIEQKSGIGLLGMVDPT